MSLVNALDLDLSVAKNVRLLTISKSDNILLLFCLFRSIPVDLEAFIDVVRHLPVPRPKETKAPSHCPMSDSLSVLRWSCRSQESSLHQRETRVIFISWFRGADS